MKSEGGLQRLARANGIEPIYEAGGARHQASDESLKAVLSVLGVPAGSMSEIKESLRTESPPMVEPGSALWMGEKPRLKLKILRSMTGSEIECELRLECGAVSTWSFLPKECRQLKETKVGRGSYSVFELGLPELPMGCHTATLRSKAGLWRTMLIVAPTVSYSDPELAGSWGIFLPVYAAHSKASWGAGNLGDYLRLSRWVARQGGAFVGSVPMLAAFVEDWCCEPSPYAPASRLFWNEFFIDVTATPEFAGSAKARRKFESRGFRAAVRDFQASSLIDYREEMEARKDILQAMAADFFRKPGARRDAFEAFLRERPDVKDYARFRAYGEMTRQPWVNWKEPMRDGSLASVDEDRARHYTFTQWLVQEQVDRLAHADKAARFYLDLPLGAHPYSFDTWREQDAFAQEASVGAPPDQFFSKGQNWHFAPPHPINIRRQWHHYFRRVLEFHMKQTGLLRIDHAMSLYRLFWIPKNGSPADGVYVRYPAEELCALISLESHRYKTVVVGENLGTVPPEVNDLMKRHKFRGMHVLQFSLQPGKEPVAPPEAGVLASLGTHDTPTFTAFWCGDDIANRLKLNLITPEEAEAQRRERTEMTQRIDRYLRRCGWLSTSGHGTIDVIAAGLRYLAGSQAEMLSIDLEDLWEERDSQNTPGTTDERPNWRRKARHSLEDVIRMRRVKAILSEITRLRQKTFKSQ